MSKEIKIGSLREEILTSIGDFLYGEGFAPNDILKEGILEQINLISDYKEEGAHLYPEIIIINDLSIFATIPNREIIIAENAISVSEFINVIKLCAPLAIGSWVIFVEIKDDRLKYGLIDAELTETSFSLYEHTVGDLAVEVEDVNLAYLRNIGSKSVEMSGLKKKLVVSLTLDSIEVTERNYVKEIATEICKSVDVDGQTEIITYINKILNEAIKEGHGNLIGVIKEEEFSDIKGELTDGEYLQNSIDLASYVKFTEAEKTNESSVALKAFSLVFKSMLNHDGITLITDTGKVICYHLFIQPFEKDGEAPVGGARSRAFQSMVNSNLFEALSLIHI